MFKYNDCNLITLSVINHRYSDVLLFLSYGEVYYSCFQGLNVFSGLVISEALPISKPIRQGQSKEQ